MSHIDKIKALKSSPNHAVQLENLQAAAWDRALEAISSGDDSAATDALLLSLMLAN